MFKAQTALISLICLLFPLSYAQAEEQSDLILHKVSLVTGKTTATRLTPTKTLKKHLNPKGLYLRSSTALIMDQREGIVLYDKEVDKQMPIASVTKLMTAMVILDAKLDPDEKIRTQR